MKVTGILCWYQENPLWLTAAITAIAPALDHLIALDGGYFLYPGALEQPSSNVEQSIAVLEATAACNLGLTLYRPSQPFMENEVEKRNMSLDLAETIKEVDTDWLLVFDADMIARKFDRAYLRQDLQQSDHLVAQYARYESPEDEGFTPVRGMYRFVPGLAYGPAHWCVSAPTDGPRIWLWGKPDIHEPYAEALDLSSILKFDHRNTRRNSVRAAKVKEYYAQRDALGIERLADTMVQDLDGNWVNTRERAWSANHGN